MEKIGTNFVIEWEKNRDTGKTRRGRREGREKRRGIQGRGRDRGEREVILVYGMLSNEYECDMCTECSVQISLGVSEVSVFMCFTSGCKPFFVKVIFGAALFTEV